METLPIDLRDMVNNCLISPLRSFLRHRAGKGLEIGQNLFHMITMDSKNTENTNSRPGASKNGDARPTMAGGVFIALGTIIGTIAGGLAFGQPSIGFLVGFGLGALLALAIMLLEKSAGRS